MVLNRCSFKLFGFDVVISGFEGSFLNFWHIVKKCKVALDVLLLLKLPRRSRVICEHLSMRAYIFWSGGSQNKETKRACTLK